MLFTITILAFKCTSASTGWQIEALVHRCSSNGSDFRHLATNHILYCNFRHRLGCELLSWVPPNLTGPGHDRRIRRARASHGTLPEGTVTPRGRHGTKPADITQPSSPDSSPPTASRYYISTIRGLVCIAGITLSESKYVLPFTLLVIHFSVSNWRGITLHE